MKTLEIVRKIKEGKIVGSEAALKAAKNLRSAYNIHAAIFLNTSKMSAEDFNLIQIETGAELKCFKVKTGSYFNTLVVVYSL